MMPQNTKTDASHYAPSSSNQTMGTVLRIRSTVVDVQFDPNAIPEIYNRLTIECKDAHIPS